MCDMNCKFYVDTLYDVDETPLYSSSVELLGIKAWILSSYFPKSVEEIWYIALNDIQKLKQPWLA